MKKEHNEKAIIILTIFLFLILLYFCAQIYEKIWKKTIQASYVEQIAVEVPEILKNQNPIDIIQMIEKNRNVDIREEMVYEEMDLEYTTQYVDNEDLPSGTIHVSQIGMTGVQNVITIKKYKGDELISEQIVASNIQKPSVNKIVEIGTGKRKK